LCLACVLVAACSSSKHASPRPVPATSTSTIAAVIGTPANNVATTSTCTYDVNIDAITGLNATASAIGWAGNGAGVVTCLGGAFAARHTVYRFGIYAGGPTTWVDADGYLPAQVTTFARKGAHVAITEFADQVTIGRHAYVVVYARVTMSNPTDRVIFVSPEPSRGLIALDRAGNGVDAHRTASDDYAVVVDRFGQSSPWPTTPALRTAGGFDQHFAHMRAFWKRQLGQIAQVSVPDPQLNDAYKSGFIYTQIARSGTHLNTGVNGYASEFSHDVIGILANLFTQGYTTNAHALLLEARNVVGAQFQYEDGLWTYAWPWAIYLMKTGDLAFVKANFATSGPVAATQPSIEAAAHRIAADRTGPNGIIGVTDDIDSNGYWTVDDEEALLGLAAYQYLATRVGNPTEAQWARSEYGSLLSAVNRTLGATIASAHLDYLPCSMVEPNTANRCDNPHDANWAAPFLFGRWAWDAPLFGATVNGPAFSMIDSTYAYGFKRLARTLPADTFGGYPGDYYSTGYNAGYGSGGLASSRYRDQGIRSYEFMVARTQSGPYSWWESSSAPAPRTPWVGAHPSAGQGASPHAWGIANANKVLLDALVAQSSDGTLLVGRGVPNAWLRPGNTISVANFPTIDGRRVSLTITAGDNALTLMLSGAPTSTVVFELPAFVNNLASTTAGTVDRSAGSVELGPKDRTVTVRLKRGPSS